MESDASQESRVILDSRRGNGLHCLLYETDFQSPIHFSALFISFFFQFKSIRLRWCCSPSLNNQQPNLYHSMIVQTNFGRGIMLTMDRILYLEVFFFESFIRSCSHIWLVTANRQEKTGTRLLDSNLLWSHPQPPSDHDTFFFQCSQNPNSTCWRPLANSA